MVERPAAMWMRRRPVLVVGALVAVMILAWILAMPRSAGPDEPGHLIRAAALVRGQLDGVPLADGLSNDGFELPSHIGAPDPVCFAFDRYQPATCVPPIPTDGDEVLLGTRSADYPIWGHLPAGVGTFAPATWSTYAARGTDALIPAGLLIAALALAAKRGPLAAGAVVLAMTPMAWFIFAVVNPSALVIAGGVALWVALTTAGGHDRHVGWLASAGWAAMVLPRRDGLVWAALIVALVLIIDGEHDPRGRWSRLGRFPQALVIGSTLATLAWASRSATNASLALFAAPLAPFAALAAVRIWSMPRMRSRRARTALAFAGVVVVVAAAGAVMSRRIDGFDSTALRLTMERTGGDLTESIGILGWLDTPLPTSVTYLYVLALGVLVGLALSFKATSTLLGASGILITAVVSSWTLTMLQNDATGTYWQGRYYLPLLIGVPIVLSRVDVSVERRQRFGVVIAGIGLIVSNVALAVTMQRFATGAAGSLWPPDWDTYGAPVPPVLLLVAHGAASLGLATWVAICAAERPISSAE